jgi:hypothetical protein
MCLPAIRRRDSGWQVMSFRPWLSTWAAGRHVRLGVAGGQHVRLGVAGGRIHWAAHSQNENDLRTPLCTVEKAAVAVYPHQSSLPHMCARDA